MVHIISFDTANGIYDLIFPTQYVLLPWITFVTFERFRNVWTF